MRIRPFDNHYHGFRNNLDISLLNMAVTSNSRDKKNFSKKHMLILLLLGVIILISVLYYTNNPDNEDILYNEEVKDSSTCDTTCHIVDFKGYNNSENNSFLKAHVNNEIVCLDCHVQVEDNDSETPHYEVGYKVSCQKGCHEDMDWLIIISDLQTPLAGKNIKINGDMIMKIQIIGAGCPRCNETEMNVFNACAELDLAADISHVYDQKEIAKFGAIGMPSVIVDGKVVISGRVPTKDELKNLLSKEIK